LQRLAILFMMVSYNTTWCDLENKNFNISNENRQNFRSSLVNYMTTMTGHALAQLFSLLQSTTRLQWRTSWLINLSTFLTLVVIMQSHQFTCLSFLWSPTSNTSMFLLCTPVPCIIYMIAWVYDSKFTPKALHPLLRPTST
jgi:NADH:ubiquinone oxidoreductase subunit H